MQVDSLGDDGSDVHLLFHAFQFRLGGANQDSDFFGDLLLNVTLAQVGQSWKAFILADDAHYRISNFLLAPRGKKWLLSGDRWGQSLAAVDSCRCTRIDNH